MASAAAAVAQPAPPPVGNPAAAATVPPAPTDDTRPLVSPKDWIPAVASLITLAGVLIGLLYNARVAARSLAITGWQKANEAEIKEINERLNNFYGKLTLILARDHVFAQSVRSRQKDGYRLLVSLFDPAWKEGLAPGDAALVDQACLAAKELDELITANLAMIDRTMFKHFLAAATHFRVLHLAHAGELGADGAAFEGYVYPRSFDSIVNLKVNSLIDRRAKLVTNFSSFNGIAGEVAVPSTQEYELIWFPDPDARLERLFRPTQAPSPPER